MLLDFVSVNDGCSKRYSSVKGSLYKASKSFLCSVCICPTDSEVKFCVDVSDGLV